MTASLNCAAYPHPHHVRLHEFIFVLGYRMIFISSKLICVFVYRQQASPALSNLEPGCIVYVCVILYMHLCVFLFVFMYLCVFVFVASFPALSTLEPGCILAASLQDHGQHTATALQHYVFVRVCICICVMILGCIFVTF